MNLKISTYYPIIIMMFMLCNFAKVYGQNREARLTLRVLDALDNTPIEDAQIAIRQCRCGGITKANGVFSMTLSKREYDIEIYFIGFRGEERHINLTENTELTVLLYEQQEELSEVIIRAKRNVDNIESPQMGALQLEVQELKKVPMAIGEFDVLRGMSLLPGVNNAGDLSNGLSVRGGSLDQNLILYDYAPVFNPTHLFGLFSVFTPELISQVDLYRANIPARYGGRNSSVLDVKVKNPFPEKFKMNGGIGIVSSRLAIETPIIKDKVNLTAGGRVGFTDFLLPLFSERLDNTKSNFQDITAKINWLISPKDQISLTGFYSADFYQLDLITKIENINAANNQYDFSTLNGTLSWLHTFENQSNLRTYLVSSNYEANNIFPEVDSPNEITFRSSIDYLSLVSEYSTSSEQPVSYYAGIQANKYRISPGILDPGNGNSINPVSLEDENSYEFSTYANLNWEATDQLTLSAGLRMNHFVLVGPFTNPVFDDSGRNLTGTQNFEKGAGVKTYNNIEPRFGLNFRLGENTSLKASYARLSQYLQNIYNTATPLPTSRWKSSDPYIKPQKSDAIGFGIYQNLWENQVELSLESYYRKSQNSLTYRAGADFFLEPYLQREVIQGQGQAYGVELGVRKPEGKVNGWLNYTWSRSLLRSQSELLIDRINNNEWYPSEFDRPHVFNGTVNFESDVYNTWSFNLTVQSGRPYSSPNAVFPLQDIDIPIFIERNNARLRPYHRLDFSWKVKYSKKLNRRWVGDWTFTVYNVYGRRNPFNLYYTQRDGTVNADVFLDSPLGAYEIAVLNSPVFAITYNFAFD